MLTQHQHTSSAVALALPSSAHSMHTLWNGALLKTYSVMCVGEAAHMRWVGSVINHFFFFFFTFFCIRGSVCSHSHVRASADCMAFMWEEAFWHVGMLVWAQKTPGQSVGTWHKTSLDTAQTDMPKREKKNLWDNKKRLEVMRTTLSIMGTQSRQRQQLRLLKGDNSVQVR